jgi:hypothetical protein
LNECSAGLAEEAFARFDQGWPSTQLQTYITSISEHDDREDLHGRLSMWRAFGNSTARVGIIVKLDVDYGKNLSLGAILSPVGYFTDDELAAELDQVVNNIRENASFLRGIDRTWLLNSVFEMLAAAVVSLKHEGFAEEREWRIVYSPTHRSSPHILSSIEVVAGVPQRIYKIPLSSNAQAGLTGLSPNELIDRIIIGPTQFPFAMFDAFVAELERADVADAGRKVRVSQIPVRT